MHIILHRCIMCQEKVWCMIDRGHRYRINDNLWHEIFHVKRCCHMQPWCLWLRPRESIHTRVCYWTHCQLIPTVICWCMFLAEPMDKLYLQSETGLFLNWYCKSFPSGNWLFLTLYEAKLFALCIIIFH